MEGLKKKRKTARQNVTKALNAAKEELGREPQQPVKLKACLKVLEEVRAKILIADDNFMDAFDGADEEAEAEVGSASRYIMDLAEVAVMLEEALSPAPLLFPENQGSGPGSVLVVGNEEGAHCKLPKIELKKFDGELKNWLSWWGQFQKIHDNPRLSNPDKLHYLAQATLKGSVARDVVEAYAQSGDNYPHAIEALKGRFGKEKVLIQLYIREMLKTAIENTANKEGTTIAKLQLQLDAHVRSLETLGVKRELMNLFLFPLMEWSLPKEVMVIWQHSPAHVKEEQPDADPPVFRMDHLLNFLKEEVSHEQDRKMADGGLTLGRTSKGQDRNQGRGDRGQKRTRADEDSPTAASLYGGSAQECLFCAKTNHASSACHKAKNMPLQTKRAKVKEGRCCFICFKKGHMARDCKEEIVCVLCNKRHHPVMCPDSPAHRKEAEENLNNSMVHLDLTQSTSGTVLGHAGIHCGGDVLLKTVLVKIPGPRGHLTARLLFDEGSQRSYVSEFVISQIQSKSESVEMVRNVMIDGTVSNTTSFNKHQVQLRSLDDKIKVDLILRERPQIGGIPPRAMMGPWFQTLKKKGIWILDNAHTITDRPDIDVLIGADYREQLMTGRRVDLQNGLFAVESVFGWMLCGPTTATDMGAAGMVIHSYLSGDINQLWDLDVIGIKETATKISQEEGELEVKRALQEGIVQEPDGRYQIKLPWVNDGAKNCLPNNYGVAKKRLENATAKLMKQEKFQVYDDVFKGWEQEGIIEQVFADEQTSGHYLPHRPVFKDSATTPVRPVFDASCRVGKNPSLNQCLEKGPNMLELIPSILLRFRAKKIGVIADIRKAFQMISVEADDRNYQKFLWWEGMDLKKIKIFRHSRVVFGLNCSPFLLAAVLEHHLNNAEGAQRPVAELFLKSTYVDNCVVSFEKEKDYEMFRRMSTKLLAEAKMDLRQWEGSCEEGVTNVLGLKWDKKRDQLYCQVPEVKPELEVTKRSVLSIVSQVFDPIGFLCPALLQPKMLLQECWSANLGWDQVWEDVQAKRFLTWTEQLPILEDIKIPRHAFQMRAKDIKSCQLHMFCDASKNAYAASVFIRIETANQVFVQLLGAKSRVAPLEKKGKQVTIPRLELLGCLIGARLLTSIKKALGMEDIETFMWCDSMSALAWIFRDEDWGTFVGNRVREIRKLIDVHCWRHIPGHLNPADLPSRGCSPEELLLSRWWEGPDWLKQGKECWPHSSESVCEQEVAEGRKKTTVQSASEVCASYQVCADVGVNKLRFSSYVKNVRFSVYLMRLKANIAKKKIGEPLIKVKWPTHKEMKEGERVLITAVQQRHFQTIPEVRGMQVIRGEDGLYRVKTRLTFKDDSEEFRSPILLPKCDPVVDQLIRYVHEVHGHPGGQFVLNKIREKYWIVQGRKTVNGVLQKCVTCQKQRVKSAQVEPAPLPKQRVEGVAAFQTTGVDLAGPIIVKGGKKVWVVLYTCAMFRGVSLDLVESLSTEAFLHSLERFMNSVGRPSQMFSDNGTNFQGARNLMKMLNWELLEKQMNAKEIRWTFIPPSAPWWGGWWERLIRTMKELLRKMIGKAKLSEDELRTCLAAVSNTINTRPLTAVTEDGSDLIPLTPAMFIRPLSFGAFVEGPVLTGKDLVGVYSKMQVLKEALQARFRKEYLGLLVQNQKRGPAKPIKFGDIVLIGSENKKRFEWPLGRIEKLFEGRDGKVRTAEVKTRSGIVTRALQRLYPVELPEAPEFLIPFSPNILHKEVTPPEETCDAEEEQEEVPETTSQVKTRFGRSVKKPNRYQAWNR